MTVVPPRPRQGSRTFSNRGPLRQEDPPNPSGTPFLRSPGWSEPTAGARRLSSSPFKPSWISGAGRRGSFD
jgi:hypothetical protein